MKNRIKTVMNEVFECSVSDDASQQNTENWDSLRHLNLMIALETEFDVEFEPEEIAVMKDIFAIEKFIISKNK